jgi:hypothetical protein
MLSLLVENLDLYFHYSHLQHPSDTPHYHLFLKLPALPFSCENQTSYMKDSWHFDSKTEVLVKTAVTFIMFHSLRSSIMTFLYLLSLPLIKLVVY